ncbi:hypothetical protein ACFE04_026821 [Oxalis oulophora]
MALSNKFLLLIVLLLALFQFSIDTDYIVGDTEGWIPMSVLDYGGCSGLQVTEKHSNNVIQHLQLQHIRDKIVLEKAEHYYFLCGFPGHCQAGQKLDILVKPAASSSDNIAGNESNPMASSPSSIPDYTASSATTPNTATVPMMVVAEAF